ncbi:MAG TPA: DnaJ domain-containing protein [Bdellovibrionota bacterium]|nr:DnaJ domain-containing protein [Bdellovibrionota bacterium]
MELPHLSPSASTKLSGALPLLAVASAVRGQLTGTLKIQSDKIVRYWEFSVGNCVNVASNAKSELPGSFLQKEGRFNAAQFDAYLAEIQKTKSAHHWDIAKRLAALTDAEVVTLRERWALRIVSTLAASSPSEISFEPKPGREGTILLSGIRLLMKAAEPIQAADIPKLCDAFTPSSVVHADEKREKTFEPLPLDAEEKGLLTVVKNSKTIQEVFSSSFLKPDRITSLLFAYFLAGLVEFESAEVAAQKTHEASLSDAQRTLHQQMAAKAQSLDKTSYYDWIGVTPKSSSEEIERKATEIMELYAAPSIEKLFQERDKTIPGLLLKKLEEARRILLDPTKRKEYDGFLAGGKTGSFAATSVSLREEEVVRQAEALLASNQADQAVALVDRALRDVPNSVTLIIRYAQLLLKTKGPADSAARDRALAELKRGMTFKPPKPEVFEAVGAWCLALGQKPKAMDAFKRALELAPFSAPARDGLQEADSANAPRILVDILFQHRGSLDFYQLLGVDPRANVRTIQNAYRDCTKRFHPDRFFQSEAELKEHSKEIYKRMVEAYVTLKNPSKRSAYDEKRGGTISDSGSGAGSDEPSHERVSTASTPETRQGKKFYEIALAAIREGKLDSAKLNLQLGLQVEPNSRALKEKLNELLGTASSAKP